MKNVNLKPLEQSVIQPWGMESTTLGKKWVGNSKTFFGQHQRGSQLTPAEVHAAAQKLFPDWFTDEELQTVDLTTSEIVKRLNLGGGNKDFGEPRLQLYYYERTREYLVIDAMELVDQISIAERMAKTGQRAKARLEYALQIATSQMKLELSAGKQQEVLEQFLDESRGAELAATWAEKNTKTLKEAVHAVLDNEENGNGEEAKAQRAKK